MKSVILLIPVHAVLLVIGNVIIRPADGLQAFDIGMARPTGTASGLNAQNLLRIVGEHITGGPARHLLDGRRDFPFRVEHLARLICNRSHIKFPPR